MQEEQEVLGEEVSLQQKKLEKEAQELVSTLREVEVFLGNLPKQAAWTSQLVTDVGARAVRSGALQITEETAEHVFRKIVKVFKELGWTEEKGAEFINAHLHYEGSIPYCSSQEIEAAQR